MTSRSTVLVTDAHELAGLATARSIGRAGHTVITSSQTAAPGVPAAASRYVDRHLSSPNPWEEHLQYQEWLREQMRSGDVEVVFPVSEASMVACVALESTAATADVSIVMPDEASRRIALSKATATTLAQQSGLFIPPTATWLLDSVFDDEAIAERGFPLLVKSDNCLTDAGTYRRGRTWLIPDAASLAVVRQHLSGLRCRAIVQGLVDGTGVSVCCALTDGQVQLSFGHRRMHEVPYSGGWSSLRRSHHDGHLFDAAEKFLTDQHYSGLAMVEFRQSRDGSPYFLEVNGRPWGSMALALHAGADFPLHALDETLRRTGKGGGAAPAPRTVRPRRSVICMNLVPGEIEHLRSIVHADDLPTAKRRWLLIRQIGSVVGRLLDPRTRHDHLLLRDPRPAVVVVRQTRRRMLRRTRSPRHDSTPLSPPELPAGPIGSVLWVCAGNICRSPFAERLFAANLPEIRSSSAGLQPNVDDVVPDWIRGSFEAHGVEWQGHRAQALTDELVDSHDLVVVMEPAQRGRFVARFPNAAQRCWPIVQLAGIGEGEIADPYTADAAEAAEIFESLASMVNSVSHRLSRRGAVVDQD